MPRQARVVIPGLAHHIAQRGNNRQDVFFVDGGRLAYLGLLREQCGGQGVRVLGYCLMTNHIHLVAIPPREDALNLAVGGNEGQPPIVDILLGLSVILAFMPRQARVVIPGLAHHITQRGNNRQDVFFVDGDRLAYLGLLREQCGKHGVRVLGYCLMTNHVHLVAIPPREDALNLAVGRTHFLHAQMINRLHGRTGHLWQGRFHSCPMDDAHTLAAMRYVERNPVRAKMTRVAWTYRWSSASAHVGKGDAANVLDLAAWSALAEGMDWREALTAADAQEELGALRLNTRTGRPLAGDRLLSKLETTLGRRLRPLPVGRPRKETK